MYNIRRYKGPLAVTSYLRFFHNQLKMSYTLTEITKGNMGAQLSKEFRNSHAEAYLVFINAPEDFRLILETVKRISPLARCLFIFKRGSYDEAVEKLKFAWKTYELFDMVIASFDHQNKLVWCMYNPFSGRFYNLAVETRRQAQVTNLRELNNLDGYSIRVRNCCWLFAQQLFIESFV